MPVVKENYDVCIVGAGHAGCEAALACARLGLETILFTISIESVAMMPCNPNIGGSSKGHLVREIDALGGEMGVNIDHTFIQSKMLNKSKGPAVHSLRAQADKADYSARMRQVLQNTDHLTLRQAEVTELMVENKVIRGVKTFSGAEYYAKAVVLCTGTYLKARCLYGDVVNCTGPNGLQAANHLTDSLVENGVEMFRFKTGTPARIDKRSVDFSKMQEQFGDERVVPFSFTTDPEKVQIDQVSCWLTYTNEKTHEIIRDNLSRSPLFSGMIEGTGPRYCPSIEDKLRTFADKEQHQLFLEPEGNSTNEYYLNGFSSSLPWEVQWKALHKIRGFEDLHIFRPGYAIEYDYFPPTQLHHSLETKLVSGLYFAGQVNGTTGYEEAAAQGLMAGINAHRALKGEKAVVLKRDEAYIGVLIDDLVTKGVDEPYRMFTSRAEYRILLRQDNADIRLTPLGYQIGLITQKRYDHFVKKNTLVESLILFAREQSIKAAEINDYLKSINSDPLTQGRKLYDILMRNNVTFDSLQGVLPKLRKFIISNEIDPEVIEEAEIQIKYKGYIEREKFIAEKLHRLENIRIPANFDFYSMNALTIEARQKLSRIRPETIGQASRVPGVSPADVNVLLIKFGR